MSEQKPLNRREFLERAAMLGALTVGAGTILAACEAQERPERQAAAPEAGNDTFSCNDPEDIAGLSEAELATRTNNNYVDQTPNPEQRCDNCALWSDPTPGQQCGGCSVVAGPIHPAGWCTIWVPAS